MFDNIAAISSGNYINQPISIIRIAGPDAQKIVEKIFKGEKANDKKISYGHIYDGQTLIDEVLVMWFIGTEKNGKIEYKNYIGEPLIEINAHGGIVVTNQILELLLANGARLAEPGEFTKRAFLNGKMDLIKADAIHELIFAKTTKQTKASVVKFKEKTSSLIKNIIKEIEYLIGVIEVNIDYPEYDDIEKINEKDLLPKLNVLIKEVQEIVNTSESSRFIFEGVNVALVGKPNVGKSSLLNALLNEEKAIVTEIPGTTRDIVESAYQLEGILFKLIDTAGIRNTGEKIESIGIKKSLEQIKKADVVIHLTDPIQKNDEFDELIKNESLNNNKFYINVVNKMDLAKQKNNDSLYISALNKDVTALEEVLVNKFSSLNLDDEKILNNTRQLSLIKQCLNHLLDARESVVNNYSYDIVIVDITEAWESLKNIVGEVNREDLLDSMFKNFCLGK